MLIIGIGLFLVPLTCAAEGGHLHLFRYFWGPPIAITSIVLMLLGSIISGAMLILIRVKKWKGFPRRNATRIISIVLVSISLFLCLYCLIDELSYTEPNYTPPSYYPSKTSLYNAYTQADCSSPWATYEWAIYDLSYIKIDTNPYDIKGGNTTYLSKATAAIKAINSYFNVPSYVYDDMISTRALDGRQSYSNSRINIYWRYHPDTGLEVTYSLS